MLEVVGDTPPGYAEPGGSPSEVSEIVPLLCDFALTDEEMYVAVTAHVNALMSSSIRKVPASYVATQSASLRGPLLRSVGGRAPLI